MTSLAAEQNSWIASFGRLTSEREDPAWLADARRAALDRFLAAGLPGRRHEDWMYSDARRLEKHAFKRARAIPTPAPDTLRGNVLGLVEGARLVFVNGHFDPALSSTEGLPEGVRLTSLGSALATDGDAMRPALEPTQTAQGQPLADLNAAFFEDGALVDLAPGVVVERPVCVVFVMTSWQDDVVEHPRVVVRAGENAELTLLERYDAQGPGVRFTNAVTRVELDPAARVRHVRLQREGSSAFHVGFTEVYQARDSDYRSVSVSLGGTLCRQELHADLRGEGASCALSGLAAIGGHEHVDNHTVIHHRVPHGTSRELFKNIVGGHATGAFTGRVIVAPNAQKTDAVQANHNLLLSREAVAETRPQLEIHADDVQCAHGATIGQLDEEQAFYMRSRGLSARVARNLLIHGFAREVLDQIDDEGLRDRLERVLAQRVNVDAS